MKGYLVNNPIIIKFFKTDLEMYTIHVNINGRIIEREGVHLSDRYEVSEQIIKEMKESK